MLSRLTVLSSISIVALAACATPQENPYYKYSSKYKGGATTTVTQAGSVIQTAPVVYETASYETPQVPSYTRVNHDCLRKEKNHELLGAGIGGAIGAIAGKELVGGTKGTVLGAGLGGAAGYGIGDKTVNCDPQAVTVRQASTYNQQSYTTASAHSPEAYSTSSTAPTHSQQAHAVTPTVQASYAPPVIAEPYVSPTDTEFNNISGTGTPGYQVLQAQTEPVTYSQSAYGAQEVSYDYNANIIEASAATIAFPTDTRAYGAVNYGSHLVKEGDTVYSLSRKLCVGVNDIQSLNNLDTSFAINIGDSIKLPASNC